MGKQRDQVTNLLDLTRKQHQLQLALVDLLFNFDLDLWPLGRKYNLHRIHGLGGDCCVQMNTQKIKHIVLKM